MTSMISRYVAVALIASALGPASALGTPGCTGGERRVLSSAAGADEADVTTEPMGVRTADHARERGAARSVQRPVSEAVARAILAEKFRAAGFRIRYDMALERRGFALTLDGLDPDHRVGYEYIDEVERGIDVDDLERSALARDSEYDILIVDAVGLSDLETVAERFLSQHESH